MSIFFPCFLYIIEYKRCYLFHKIFYPKTKIHLANFPVYGTIRGDYVRRDFIILKKEVCYDFSKQHHTARRQEGAV